MRKIKKLKETNNILKQNQLKNRNMRTGEK